MSTGAAIKLALINTELQFKFGELAEVKKAELQAEHDGFQGENVTAARHNAKMTAITYTQERFDLEADIAGLTNWREFYTVLISSGTELDVSTYPPKE